MARYHVSKDGKPRRCWAIRSCPLAQRDENGKIVNHFDSKAEAGRYAEKIAAEGRENTGSLSKAAQDRSAAARVLEEHSTDPDGLVRDTVSENTDTPAPWLVKIEKEEYTVAENPNTPPAVLAKLSTDPDMYVRINVSENPNTPPDVLAKLSEDPDELVRYHVSENPNTPAGSLIKLSTDPVRDIRGAVAEHPNTPLNVVEKLSHDEDPLVRQWALDELEDRRRKNDR